MSSAGKIKRLFAKSDVTVNSKVDDRTINDALTALDKSEKIKSLSAEPNIWRITMKNKIARITAAAVIIIAVLVGLNLIGGPDVENLSWADVASQINDVHYVHFYEVSNREDDFPAIREGWYAHGKLRSRSCGGFSSYGAYQTFDDGQEWMVFDRHNNITCLGESHLARHQDFFEAIAGGGMLSLDFSQFSSRTPALVESDFLIYDFDPPEEADWIDKISVTVGRKSLMPMQIKTYYKVEKWYSTHDLLLFDYEEPEKPAEFFQPPTETKPPHGVGQVVLGGDAVEIELRNAPGIKSAEVRLHTKFDGPVEDISPPYRERYTLVDGPVYFMEITFVLDEGYRSITSKKCPLWLDQGVKAALGNQDNWPDGKYRNIRFTPVLRATDNENVFMLELSCWLRTKDM